MGPCRIVCMPCILGTQTCPWVLTKGPDTDEPGRNRPPWALMSQALIGWALMGPAGPSWAGPYWAVP